MNIVLLEITCPALTNPSNGSVSYGGSLSNSDSSYSFNVTATYNCNTGFSLVGGNNTRTCTGNGSSTTGAFNGVSPICERELYIPYIVVQNMCF